MLSQPRRDSKPDMPRYCHIIAMLCLLRSWTLATDSAHQPPGPTVLRGERIAGFLLTGHVLNAAGTGVAGATLNEKRASATADGNGTFNMVLAAGDHILQVHAQGYDALSVPVTLTSDAELTIQLGESSTVNVVASVDEFDSSAQRSQRR